MINVHKIHISVADGQLEAWLNSLQLLAGSSVISIVAVGDFWYAFTRT